MKYFVGFFAVVGLVETAILFIGIMIHRDASKYDEILKNCESESDLYDLFHRKN